MQVSKPGSFVTIAREEFFLAILALSIIIIPSVARAQNKATNDPAVNGNAASSVRKGKWQRTACGAVH